MTATLGVYLLATRGVPILLFCAVEQTLSRSVNFAPRPVAQVALP